MAPNERQEGKEKKNIQKKVVGEKKKVMSRIYEAYRRGEPVMEGQWMGVGIMDNERKVQRRRYLTILFCVPTLQLMWSQKDSQVLPAVK